MPSPERSPLEESLRALAERCSAAGRRLGASLAEQRRRLARRRNEADVRLRRARRELLRANAMHRVRIVKARLELRLAVSRHRLACRRAERAVRSAEKEAGTRVARADEYLRTVARPRQIARYGPFSLFDNSLQSPDWEVSLASVHAVILPAESAALKGVGSEALPATEPRVRPRKNRLALQGRRGASVHDFPRNDPRARDFAHLVNVAALNAGKFDQQRREDMDAAAERLGEARAWADRHLADAHAHLETATTDTTTLDAARRRLAKAQLDTGEVDACRARIEALEEAVRTARLELPPDPDDLPTE